MRALKPRSVKFLESLLDPEFRRDLGNGRDATGFASTIADLQSVSRMTGFLSKYANAAGSNAPIFCNELELDAIRTRCRVIAQAFPLAINAMDNLVNYTVGTGYQFTCTARYGNLSADFIKACNRVMDEFLERKQFALEMARELFRTYREDGDRAAAIFDLGDGYADVRLIEGQYITAPSNPAAVEHWLGDGYSGDWSYGVRTVTGDTERKLGYYVQWSETPGDFDYFPAEMVELVKGNVRTSVKRGVSDFHPVLLWLYYHATLNKNTAVASAALSAIAYIEEYADNVTQADAEALALGGSAYTYEISGDTGSETRYASTQEAGQIVGLSKGVKYVPGPMGSERGPHFIEVAAAVARLIGCRWNMPEYLISGDASNANYASTMVAESPWVKATQARQAYFAVPQINILTRVLWFAFREGRLRDLSIDTLADFRAAVKIVATPPQVEVRDTAKETTRNETLNKNGVLSTKTWAEREALDYDEEIKRGARRLELQPMPLPGSPTLPTAKEIVREMWNGYPV